MADEVFTDNDKQEVVKFMLKMIGENPDREGLTGTPDRVVRMWKEIFRGYDSTHLPKVTTFMNGRDNITYDEMINDEGSFYSHCEHHMVPFFGRYYFAYIPNSKGKILGLSKVARVVDYFSAKLQIQERLAKDILDYLWQELTIVNKDENDVPTEIIEPVGMALVLDGSHLCKEMRGAKKPGIMRTTFLKSAIKIDAATRAEFMHWVNGGRRR